MAQLELDPLFLKALRLLHSKAKDSAEQLRQLIEDTLVQRQGASGGSTGRDTKTLLTTIKLESDGKAHLLGRRQSPKQDTGTGNNGGPPALSAIRSLSSDEPRRKDPPPLECKPPPLPISATKADTPSPVLEVSGLLEAKRARTESPQLASSQSASPASRLASSSSPDSSSDGEDFTVDMGQVCVMCNQQDVTAKNQLIECQECHCLYHQECHRPPATDYDVNDPRLVWYCARCTKNMKKMTIKPPKPASKVPFGVPRELTPPSKPDTPPPLTSQPFKRAELKVPALSSSAGPNKPIGLAGLAANLSKPKPLKPMGSTVQPQKPLPTAFQNLSSLAAAATALKSGSSTAGSSKGNNGGNGSSSSSSSSGPSPPALVPVSTAGGNGKSASSSLLMSADKRLQIMKKKAAAKMQEKRRVTSK
ncbi:LOW QUALITY PROTEIN: integrator complex subunit 12-like [Dermacentor silvarum]|uniref:LOW QUALITY PROTEIN: integrator complex subunit 12-like n=1 Tax=Dermacentor silvarum TaxID=543639 RepID=UPI00189AEF95|nr:LOW QUALITY PROTEIN: integrator complex subunit 12-like [Dermacentor silvarum]